MVSFIQTSRKSLLSLCKTLIPNTHNRFPLQTNDIISKFPPIFSTNPFSTSTVQHKSPFESNLLSMLTNEIEFESEYAPPHQPDKKFNAFMVEDRPGEQFVTLKGRSTIDENIKIEATMFDGYATISKGENSEPDAQLHISLLVDISKGEEGGDMLEFVCSAWPEKLEIQKFYVIRVDEMLAKPYTGRDFRVLDKKLQSALMEFLNARGVNNDLACFLHRYVWNKDKLENIQRLKLLKSYVQI
ncbi:hypothetical protein L1887_28748 [Cichorium endivia]|nr:hypothetical protein L1887_28748 [Cichorium endivia]